MLRLEGDVNIAGAAELKNLLLQAFGVGKELRVEMVPPGELDITALQLLWAARGEAKEAGLGFALAGQLLAESSATAKNAGFEEFPVPVDAVS